MAGAKLPLILGLVCSVFSFDGYFRQGNQELLVSTDQGKLQGITGNNFDGKTIYKFLGIPYAKPPLDHLRFQLPQPGDSWTGVRNASQPGDTCISIDNFSTDIVGSEDCLYLNVYTKSLPSTCKRSSKLNPVMVYIYGGGLTMGSSNPAVVGPEFLLLKDIVLVTFNYRLGVLGFLSFDDETLNLPGNLGLKDQVLALKWVQRNIKKFNGDPDNVTIFGNSAGASSAHTHVLSAASKGLFHRAILQSGTALTSDFWGSKNNAIEVASKAGRNVSNDREALEVLRGLSVQEIYAAQTKVLDPPFPRDKRPFCAVREYPNPSAIIPFNPVDIIKGGMYNQVPIMLGYTDTEGMLFDLVDGAASRIGANLTDEDLALIIPYNMGVAPNSADSKEIVAILRELYKGKPYRERYDPVTDSVLLVSSMEAVRLHLKTLTHPIFIYRMSLDAKLNQLKLLLGWLQNPGAAHSDELGYIFNTAITPTIIPGSLEDKSMRRFVELWTNFARFGNPTPRGTKLGVTWEAVKSEDNIRVLDIGAELQMRDIPEKSRLDVWWRLLKKWPFVKFE